MPMAPTPTLQLLQLSLFTALILVAAEVHADEPVPDFAIFDVNATSATFEERVSPRDHLGHVSAWYFGHAT